MKNEKRMGLLGLLRHNSRISLSDLSSRSSISTVSLAKSLNYFRKGVIIKCCSLLDTSKIGYNIKVHFIVKARRENELREFVKNNPYVNSCCVLMDENGLYIECFFRSLKQMSTFREELDKFKPERVEELFVTEDLKREGFIPS